MLRTVFAALSKVIAQFSDPAFRGVLLRALAASTALFVVVWIAAWLALSWTGAALSDWIAAQDVDGYMVTVLQWLFGALSVAGVLVASFLLCPAATVLILSFLLEDIAAAVERRYYPGLPAARDQPVMEAMQGALGFAGVTILLNLLALPLYLLLLFVPPLNLFVFYGLNGYLLGREYFELVALRRLEAAVARRLRRRYRGRVFMAGVVVAFLLTLPLINLVAPIVATGLMVHVFEQVRRHGGVPEAAST
jgi:uncharacterized protein involved in cysteine biosynthesis